MVAERQVDRVRVRRKPLRSTERRLGRDTQARVRRWHPAWSPETRQIVFERYLCCETFGGNPTSLSIIGADGQDPRVLTYGPNRPAQAR
jgi:hypothetical protein